MAVGQHSYWRVCGLSSQQHLMMMMIIINDNEDFSYLTSTKNKLTNIQSLT